MNKKFLLGLDIGSSSVKASYIDAITGELIASANSPETEMKIESSKSGWAEQHPETWWHHTVEAVKKITSKVNVSTFEVLGIGISYQMHGLVLVDADQKVLYPSIIWCDSRAVETGNKAFKELGEEFCLEHFLNSPANFTASKLRWVKENLPDIYSRTYKFMLPGDYIAMKLTGRITTTISGLSEGIFWNFKNERIANEVLHYYKIHENLIPDIVPNFGDQGVVNKKAADELGLKHGIPVAYRAGDQPNNALSLNVLNPGEIAATAGTSGVIYGVDNKNIFDPQNRVNTFAHVNYTKSKHNVGVLLCINGTGIQYSWIKQQLFENKYSYNEMNTFASAVSPGSQGLMCFPFGNGAERVLTNKRIDAHFSGIDFNLHKKEHVINAAQEGIVFTFRYGLEVMKSMNMKFNVVRAGNSNLFQSPVFRKAFVNTCNVALELYNTDGSQGAARGAGIGTGLFSEVAAFKGLKLVEELLPDPELVNQYDSVYKKWEEILRSKLNVN
ncbi:MAG: carbohydrate kinase [Ignavibacteriales bacterium]|nr:MAG: carbohydrate kinase [Ignavibacteriales bacterium]